MCGIAGYATTDQGTDQSPILRQMVSALEHRGPDDEGFLISPGVGLGMRRLSVVDLASGHQPITNEDKTVHVICNGEIYNYVELRTELRKRGHRLTTQSDTETLVHLYEDHGIGMLQFLRGMFAFALWDVRKQSLFLARDRLGKKPLNYALANHSLYFCSEIAPLLDAKIASWEIDPGALAEYLMFGFVSAPRSFVRSIQKLPPAHYLVWQSGQINVQRYWSFTQQPKTTRSYEDALEEIGAKLDESIQLRLRSDVPVGLLLSGGIDSNAILARLARLGKKVQAFTIGFPDRDYDETAIAGASAKHFAVQHHVLRGTTDLLDLLPEAVRHYGEPSADKSILPTMLVCGLTRQHVKVALSGDGGDEAFAGYEKYRLRAWQTRNFFSRKAREHLTLRAMDNGGFRENKFRRHLLPETPSLFSGEFFTGPLWKRLTTKMLRTESNTFLTGLVSKFWSGTFSPIERMLQWDTTEPLPNSLLTKLDIASMSRSLEVRSPFLDYELIDLCAKLPNYWKGNSRQGKLILRDLIRNDLPPEVLSTRKRGFSLPLAQWWRGQARERIRAGLVPLHPALRSFLRESTILELLNDHQSNRANHAQRLWNLWVLNEWARMFLQ